MKKFSDDHKLQLSQLVKVPTAPIGIYSHKLKSLADVKDGAIVSLPDDVTDQAHAITLLQQIAWDAQAGLRSGKVVRTRYRDKPAPDKVTATWTPLNYRARWTT